MAAIGPCFLSAGVLSSTFRLEKKPSAGEARLNQSPLAMLSARPLSLAVAAATSELKSSCEIRPLSAESVDDDQRCAKTFKDYFVEARDLIKSGGGYGGGCGCPPRWFSPLESKARCDDAPVLLYLPGMDGSELGLIRQHWRLGKMFDIWCLHVPASNRTRFKDLVRMVERTIQSENQRAPDKPIYLVGESLGACIALAVAAGNPEVDLVLILANPATSYGNSVLRNLSPLTEVLPDQLNIAVPLILSLIPGDPFKGMIGHWAKGLPEKETAGNIYQDLVTMSTFSSILTDIFRRETLLWKLQLLDEAATFTNARLHLVKAQTLILSSGNDCILPSQNEGKRLQKILRKCEIRSFNDNGHCLFMEDGIDLVSIIKSSSFYRRGAHLDIVSDFFPVTVSEFNKCYGLNRMIEFISGPVFLSTKEDGKIVRGLSGIPSEGPVLLVGNHMIFASDSVSCIGQFVIERNMHVRVLGHPLLFTRLREGYFPHLPLFETARMLGGVPVSGASLHHLLSSKSHVLLYPGGVREALHRKGEAHRLLWPEKAEFVRTAAKFGATIVPFGVVGEDDFFMEFLDYNDQIKIPFLKSFIESITNEAEKPRSGMDGELGNQDLHFPGVLPKVPGRSYFYYGKPIDTEGREDVLEDKERARGLYEEVKTSVERCIEFLKEKRELDPYRPLLPRLAYHFSHGLDSQVPTFPF